MSVSRVVFGSLVTAILATTMGCKAELSIETKDRFVEPNVVKEDADPWAGQEIYIDIKGVGAAINGGVNVEANPQATKVTANARLLAMAFSNEKPNADQSIVEVKDTYKITHTADRITVECGHGGSHGSSDSGASGCELVNIVVPAGSTEQPLKLTVLGGNGTMALKLSNATVINVGANNAGDINAEIPNSVGANVSLVARGLSEIDVTLPSSWAAEEVILTGSTINNPFSEAKLGVGAGGYGTAGTGLRSLKLTAEEGTITLH